MISKGKIGNDVEDLSFSRTWLSMREDYPLDWGSWGFRGESIGENPWEEEKKIHGLELLMRESCP